MTLFIVYFCKDWIINFVCYKSVNRGFIRVGVYKKISAIQDITFIIMYVILIISKWVSICSMFTRLPEVMCKLPTSIFGLKLETGIRCWRSSVREIEPKCMT